MTDVDVNRVVTDVVSAVRATRFRWSREEDLQLGLVQLFEAKGFMFEREVILSRADRIDFMVGPVGVEVKVDGGLSEVTRQVHRYLQLERVQAIVLVTTRSRHTGMVRSMSGKPVQVVHLMSSFF